MKVKLYSIRMSHPARAAGLMLRHKGIEHEIISLPPGSQRVMLRARGFCGGTVPALKIDGRRVQGSLDISRVLEELKPEPPLFPADPRRRGEVKDAELWGEAELQPVPRRIFRWAVTQDRNLRRSLAETAGMPLPPVLATVFLPVSKYFAHLSGATAETTRADLAGLPAQFDRVDELIGSGVISGEQVNAADFQIATSVRVLMNFPQLRPLIESRPLGRHASAVVPGFGFELPVRFPPEWVPAR